jgi:hypothetical protein
MNEPERTTSAWLHRTYVPLNVLRRSKMTSLARVLCSNVELTLWLRVKSMFTYIVVHHRFPYASAYSPSSSLP